MQMAGGASFDRGGKPREAVTLIKLQAYARPEFPAEMNQAAGEVQKREAEEDPQVASHLRQEGDFQKQPRHSAATVDQLISYVGWLALEGGQPELE